MGHSGQMMKPFFVPGCTVGACWASPGGEGERETGKEGALPEEQGFPVILQMPPRRGPVRPDIPPPRMVMGATRRACRAVSTIHATREMSPTYSLRLR